MVCARFVQEDVQEKRSAGLVRSWCRIPGRFLSVFVQVFWPFFWKFSARGNVRASDENAQGRGRTGGFSVRDS